MLCWICPDCGRDCSPAVRECPACAQRQSGAGQNGVNQNGVSQISVSEIAVTNGVLSMVESFRSVPPVPLLAAAPQQYLLFGLTNGHSSVETQTMVMAEEDPAIPAGETIDSLVRPLVESAKAEPARPIAELPIPDAPPAKPAPLVNPSNPAAALPPAAVLPAVQPTAFATPPTHIAELAIPAEPAIKTAERVDPRSKLTAEPPVALRLRVEEHAPTPAPAMRFAELAIPPNPPAKTAPRIQIRCRAFAPPSTPTAGATPEPVNFPATAPRIAKVARRAKPRVRVALAIKLGGPEAAKTQTLGGPSVSESTSFAPGSPRLPLHVPAQEPLWAAAGLSNPFIALSEALAIQAAELVDEIWSRMDAYEAAIRSMAAAFQMQPSVALLPAPAHIVAAPAPPDFEWLKMPRPTIPSRKLADVQCGSVVAPAQKLPLAGPSLPPELINYIEAPAPDHLRASGGMGLPGWIISFVVATSLFLFAGNGLQHLWASREAKAASIPSAPAKAVSSPVPAAAFEQHPFARFVEVTGLRVVADLSHRSQVQYIVVNHSNSPLSGLFIRIAVRSSADPVSAEPLFTVSAVVPVLGPHQSKEIRTDLDSQLRSSAIPDWEYLKTDVQVGTQN